MWGKVMVIEKSTLKSIQHSEAILLIERDPINAKIIHEAFQEGAGSIPVVHVSCSEEALAWLESHTHIGTCLILLVFDTSDPLQVEMISTIKCDNRLKQIPVIVLAREKLDIDVSSIFEMGAAGYIILSTDPDELKKQMNIIYNYWSLSQLPGIDKGI
jgi:CheY-like chemotaxis protein